MTNGDLSKRAQVDTRTVAWTAVAPGVDEKTLEDCGLEQGETELRRTSLVRLAPGASTVFGRKGCVDILVVEGELATHPAGTYIHEPAGVARDTRGGCTAIVKVRPSRSRVRTVVDTRAVTYEPSHTLGLWSAPLHEDPDGRVVLLRFDPGTAIGPHHHEDGEEFFVLQGELVDDFGRYSASAWVRQPPGSLHRVTSERGCLLLTFAHHLHDVRG